MPGRFFLTRPLTEISTAIGAEEGDVPDQPPRRNIQPGQQVITLIAGPKLKVMRWGMVPVGRVNARGRPVMETIVNARSETVFEKSAFAGVGRCVVPVDGWYEWTGEKRRKTAWAIQARDRSVLWFAAICDLWQGPGGAEVWQVATVTCPPSGDVVDIHDRMGVLLAPEDVSVWLGDDEAAASILMRTAEDGLLEVSEATDVDWTAP